VTEPRAPRRLGATLPLPGHLHGQRDRLVALADAGYVDVWSLEADGPDAFSPLLLAAAWEPRLHLGTAIASVFTRGPAVLAQSAAALADAAPGRVTIGLGSSSDVIVQRWNGIPFEKPYTRVRDTLRFLRDALAGERIATSYDSFTVDGFRLSLRPEIIPPIVLAALRPRMLALAGSEADGAIVSWLSPRDVGTVAPLVGVGKLLAGRIVVCPSSDETEARALGRRAIAAYLNVPVYRAFHEWLGRGPLLQAMWEAWEAGDRTRALTAIPDEVVDDLVVHGDPDRIRRRLDEYFAAGITSSSLSLLLPPGADHQEALLSIAGTTGGG
jgi:probable F420-dependent oxidoreductase